jgi:hypothetical protein
MSLEDIAIPSIGSWHQSAGHTATQTHRTRASNLTLKRRVEAEQEAALDALQADTRPLREQIVEWFAAGNTGHMITIAKRFGRTKGAVDAALRKLEKADQASPLRAVQAVSVDGRIRPHTVWGAYDPTVKAKKAPAVQNTPMVKKAVAERSALETMWFGGAK